MSLTIDIEPTNRCNAKCNFCPRDQTPHQGLMTPEVFAASLGRAVEFRAEVERLTGDRSMANLLSLCGLGEPLLNKHVADMCAQGTAEGFSVGISSNGALLDERRGTALLDAGLKRIFLNIGDRDEDYEAVYQLPFEKVVTNVDRFLEMAEGRCDVWIVLVDYRRDREHVARMREFWGARGVTLFQDFEIMNRGGALYVDHMQYETYPQLAEAKHTLAARGGTPLCGAPFGYLFIGWDGQYYLCCSDWKKEVPLGSVFEKSFVDVVEPKLRYIRERGHLCATCNLDPTNRLTDELRARDEGEVHADVETLTDQLVHDTEFVRDMVDQLVPGALETAPTRRRSIPLTVTT
jgi:MoaA/NifB/PqqE/SkfB family radical SAM enzyme